VVIVPSGFDHVVAVAVRSDSTSTREPCARADTAADTTSGRDTTCTGFGSADGAAACAGSMTSTAVNTNANDTVAATAFDAPDNHDRNEPTSAATNSLQPGRRTRSRKEAAGDNQSPAAPVAATSLVIELRYRCGSDSTRLLLA